MNIGDLFIRVLADDKGFSADLEKKAGKAGDKAGKALGGGMKKSMGKGIAEGLGIGAALTGIGAATMAVDKLVDAIGHTIEAASDQREAMSLTGQVFEDNTEIMEDWADGAAEAFGTSKTEALNFASSFGTAFKNVGFTLDETSEKSQTLTRLAADLGSAFNKSSADAALALRSGLLGESEPMRAFGVFLSDTKVKAKALAMGMKPLNGAFSDQQKVMARYAIIMEDTADSQGMFGRDTGSLADSQKRLQAEMENVSAEIGEALLPVMTALTNLARDELVPVLQAMGEAMKDSGETVRDNQDPWGNFLNLLDDISTRGEESKTMIGALDEALSNFLDDFLDFITPWDTYTNKVDDMAAAHEQAAESARESARSLSLAGTAADTATEPIAGAADETGRLGDEAKTAAEQVEEMRQALQTAAMGIIAEYYDPIQLRQELKALKAEEVAQREIIASDKSTTAQINDARERLTEISRSTDEVNLALLATGDMTQKEISAWIRRLDRLAKEGTADAKLYVRDLKREIASLDGVTADVYIKMHEEGVGGRGGRQHGGPVRAGVPYVVGEKRAELFVPEVNGTILPQVPAGWPGAGASSVVNNYPTLTVTGALPVRTIRDISLEMQRISLGVSPARQLSPQYDRGEAG